MLIASAAAELQRQQEQELDKEVEAASAALGRLGSQSHSAGRLGGGGGGSGRVGISASAPPDVDAAAISVMAGLEDQAQEMKHQHQHPAGAGGEEKTMDGMGMGMGMGGMMQHETYLPLSGGDGGGGGGSDWGDSRGRASSLSEPRAGVGAATALKPASLTIKPRLSPGGQRWRHGVLGAPGGLGMMGASPGGGSIIGAGTLGVQCFTCTVGKKPSQAGTYVNDIDEVRLKYRRYTTWPRLPFAPLPFLFVLAFLCVGVQVLRLMDGWMDRSINWVACRVVSCRCFGVG